MTTTYHANRGFGAVAAYAGAVVGVTLLLYELGANPLGYTSLTSRIFPPSSPPSTVEGLRQGKMLVKTDDLGNCREYVFDNRTQEIVDKGTVVCDPKRAADIKTMTRSKMESFRDSFGKPR